jgi:hypothetical protein
MSTDIQHFGRQNSDGAIVSGKGLVQLRHNPTDAGSALHQMDLDAHVAQIQCGLNASNAATDDENVFQESAPYFMEFKIKSKSLKKTFMV